MPQSFPRVPDGTRQVTDGNPEKIEQKPMKTSEASAQSGEKGAGVMIGRKEEDGEASIFAIG